MIPPREQWCIQIDVTNLCTRACSNCTRMLAHDRERFVMPIPIFEQAVHALAAFPSTSPPDKAGRQKVVGIIGGEPLLHPEFPELCRIMAEAIPNPRERGLWTGLTWRHHPHRAIIEETFPQPGLAYINPNPHTGEIWHHPVLVAAQDVTLGPTRMWDAIRNCELQEHWSGSITPKGFFFCEVAAAFDMIFNGPGGLPITPECWQNPLCAFASQIALWCPRCGICLPALGKRRDNEERDDISPSNLATLHHLGSPRILAGDYVLYDPASTQPHGGASPINYLKRRR